LRKVEYRCGGKNHAFGAPAVFTLSLVVGVVGGIYSIGGGSMEAGQTRWLINGLSYEPDEHPIVVQEGATEVWEIRNDEHSMLHPMHLHGLRFRVLERVNSPQQVGRPTVDGKGRTATDLGFKNTILVLSGETVKVNVDFSHGFEGEQLYMLHCHTLEHEDAGMMLNYKVVSPQGP